MVGPAEGGPLAACRIEAECSPRTGEMLTSLEEVIRKK